MEEKEVPVSAIMYELRQIATTLDELKTTEQKILSELGGNGGPGIRTRLHALETGELHLRNRMDADRETNEERYKEYQEYRKAEEERQDNQDKQIVAMRNIGAGVVIAIGVIEVLSWLVPMLAASP